MIEYREFLYVAVTLCALAAVMSRNMLTAAISLAATSIGVSLVLFDFRAPWAAVFELSVCAGLITVLFISAVSLLRKEESFFAEDRTRFRLLPVFALIVAIGGWIAGWPFFEALADYARFGARGQSLGSMLWESRRMDLLGQIAMLAAGVLVINSVFAAKKAEK